MTQIASNGRHNLMLSWQDPKRHNVFTHGVIALERLFTVGVQVCYCMQECNRAEEALPLCVLGYMTYVETLRAAH